MPPCVLVRGVGRTYIHMRAAGWVTHVHMCVGQCGPVEECVGKAVDNFFENGQLVSWYHGFITRDGAIGLLGRTQGVGHYLVRCSVRHDDKFVVCYNESCAAAGHPAPDGCDCACGGKACGALYLAAMANTAGRRHALIGCYGRHRRPVARSSWLLWPTPQANGTL